MDRLAFSSPSCHAWHDLHDDISGGGWSNSHRLSIARSEHTATHKRESSIFCQSKTHRVHSRFGLNFLQPPWSVSIYLPLLFSCAFGLPFFFFFLFCYIFLLFKVFWILVYDLYFMILDLLWVDLNLGLFWFSDHLNSCWYLLKKTKD